jgi:ABC-2 type transport system permease protein
MNLRVAGWIARNELRRLLAHREILVFGLALPVIIITLIGLTFGSEGSIDLGVLDRDGSARSAALVDRLDEVDGVELEVYDDEDELRRDVRTTAVQAGLVLPDGYADALAAGDATLDVVVDLTSEGVASALATLEGVVSDEGVQEGAVRFVAARTADEDAARRLVQTAAGDVVPVVARDATTIRSTVDTGSFSYTAPANLVLFVFINTFVVSTVIAVDRKAGLVRRMLSTANQPAIILVGVGASRFLFALVQSSLIVGVGSLLFSVEWGDPFAAAVLTCAFAAVATAVGVLVGSWVSDADQAQAIGIPLGVAMGMLGGCMWPIDLVPRVMQVVGHLTPHAWVMDAWQELIFDDGTLTDILPNLAVLAGAALVIGLLATRQLRRTVMS